MTTKGSSFNKCRFCHSPFSNDILNKIENNREDVYCENCGDLIKRADGGLIIDSEPVKDATTDIPFFVTKLPEELSIPKDALHYPNGRVFYDTDFPPLFKTNFIIVFARLVYFHSLQLEKEGKIDLEKLEIEEDVINELHRRISPIHNNRIKAEFIKNLHEINPNEFERNLKKFQQKFHDNRQYRDDFIVYSRWLINRILRVISKKHLGEQCSKFEQIILEDLRVEFNLVKTKNYLNKKGIKNFPSKSRLIICMKIYRLLEDNCSISEIHNNLVQNLNQNEDNEIWKNEFPNNEILEIQKNFANNYTDQSNYLQDLILIVVKLNEINSKQEEPINVKKFASELIKSHLNLNMKLGPLRFFLSDLITYLNKEIETFNANKKNKQVLFDDGKRKECARCHKIKEYTEFVKRKQYRVEYICKSCKLEVSAIRMFQNKLYTISEIYKGKFNNKCSKCETDISLLPALEFHHPKQDLKEVQWSKNRHVKFTELIRKLEAEKVILLCSNCHSLSQSDVFKKYKDIILKKDLFQRSSEEIRQLILKHVKQRELYKNSEQRSKIKYNILTWIKKRYVIEQLYQGKCVCCKKFNIKDNLPGFDFHHSQENLEDPQVKLNKGSIWRRIQTSDIDLIAETLIKEGCVAICSNCHRLLHAPYFNLNVDEILDEDFATKARDIYYNSIQNLRNFNFTKKIVDDPLKERIKYGEIWKKYLTLIYLYSKKKNAINFDSKELVEQFDITLTMTIRVLKELKSKGFIKLVDEKKPIFNGNLLIGQSPRKYQLTDKGLNLARELLS